MRGTENGSDYGLVQLRDLPDMAMTGGSSKTMEARFADDVLGCEQGGVSLQSIKPGMRVPFAHRHTHDEEVYVVVAGSGRAIVEGQLALTTGSYVAGPVCRTARAESSS